MTGLVGLPLKQCSGLLVIFPEASRGYLDNLAVLSGLQGTHLAALRGPCGIGHENKVTHARFMLLTLYYLSALDYSIVVW